MPLPRILAAPRIGTFGAAWLWTVIQRKEAERRVAEDAAVERW
jgi:hypothetical protein